MDEEQLSLVEIGLADLLKEYKKNLKDGDQRRLKVTQDAKTALRKVILAVAIKGNIKDIIPVFNETKSKAGWEVVDHNNKIIRYYA